MKGLGISINPKPAKVQDFCQKQGFPHPEAALPASFNATVRENFENFHITK
jgi:hypothetical protein